MAVLFILTLIAVALLLYLSLIEGDISDNDQSGTSGRTNPSPFHVQRKAGDFVEVSDRFGIQFEGRFTSRPYIQDEFMVVDAVIGDSETTLLLGLRDLRVLVLTISSLSQVPLTQNWVGHTYHELADLGLEGKPFRAFIRLPVDDYSTPFKYSFVGLSELPQEYQRYLQDNRTTLEQLVESGEFGEATGIVTELVVVTGE